MPRRVRIVSHCVTAATGAINRQKLPINLFSIILDPAFYRELHMILFSKYFLKYNLVRKPSLEKNIYFHILFFCSDFMENTQRTSRTTWREEPLYNSIIIIPFIIKLCTLHYLYNNCCRHCKIWYKMKEKNIKK